MIKRLFSKLGPGFLFAGAAIGVSHLVQSTRAGADFGFGLLWALLLINFIKYPFFEYGPRYAIATGESLLDGYRKLGKGILVAYSIITLATMFTIQTAVTIVTAAIATSIFGNTFDIIIWSSIITTICFTILIIGRYKMLDSLMKIVVICLTISTLLAVLFAFKGAPEVSFQQIIPTETAGIAFLIAFMGWMPAPLDISIWHSMWALEKKKINTEITIKQSRFDFNVGYITTTFLAICFVSLGALVLFRSSESFSSSGGSFANQLINMYTASLGDGAKIIISIAALTTMFSTTLTTLDASPRVMSRASEILTGKRFKRGYLIWMLVLVFGTLSIFFFFISEMALLIKIATILSFLTAPFYAIINYKLVTSKHMPKEERPGKLMHIISISGIALLIGFSVWYLTSL